jgi:uncharacterized protein
VNVLVALAWPNHVHHARAIRWFKVDRQASWATCPLTETGFVRVSSNTRALPDARTPAEAIALLEQMRRVAGHVFLVDDISPTDATAGPFERVVGYRQVTDAHLLTLAMRNGGRLATFDKGVVDLAPADASVVELIP